MLGSGCCTVRHDVPLLCVHIALELHPVLQLLCTHQTRTSRSCFLRALSVSFSAWDLRTIGLANYVTYCCCPCLLSQHLCDAPAHAIAPVIRLCCVHSADTYVPVPPILFSSSSILELMMLTKALLAPCSRADVGRDATD